MHQRLWQVVQKFCKNDRIMVQHKRIPSGKNKKTGSVENDLSHERRQT